MLMLQSRQLPTKLTLNSWTTRIAPHSVGLRTTVQLLIPGVAVVWLQSELGNSMNNLREIGPALDSAAFKKLQELCGHKPPPDYAKFLQKTNGGKFEGFQYVAVPGGDTVAVDALAGLGEGTLHDALTWFEDMNMAKKTFRPVIFQ